MIPKKILFYVYYNFLYALDTIPPYSELNDSKTETFFNAKLIPACIVFFKWANESMNEKKKYLLEEIEKQGVKREKTTFNPIAKPQAISDSFPFLLTYF